METLKNKYLLVPIATLVIGFFMGWLFFSSSGEKELTKAKEGVWTCSMHPQIRKNEPGKCPICGMDLVPVESDEGRASLGINMSPTAMQLASVQTVVVKKAQPVKHLRLSGKVQADERFTSSQSSHISGRVEQLLINYTGEYVNAGQVIAYIYSPDLVTAQKELLEAYKIKDQQPGLYTAAREKLRNWKLTEKQIEELVKYGKPHESFPILADLSGVVINKRVNVGDYINRGGSLFEVANLNRVWILFDVYESDMSWVKVGSAIEYTVQSIPGEKFNGQISFIDPVIDPKTRVAKARVDVVNAGLRLKPEMFATGTLSSKIESGGPAIVIPKSAVMWTGERSIVYVKSESNSFMLREVVLGTALGDGYMVKQGLAEGEEIATHGTFSIDAAAQLAGKPSMMNPDGGTVMTGHNHGQKRSASSSVALSKSAKQELLTLLDAYVMLKENLADDDFSQAKITVKKLQKRFTAIRMSLFKGKAHETWMRHRQSLEKAIGKTVAANSIDAMRTEFISLSAHFIGLIHSFNLKGQKALYIQHCPMADNNKGADWISYDKEVRNPYYGEAMLKCGSVTNVIK